MPETRFIEFPALSDDPRVVISRSASETDVRLFYLNFTLEIVIRNVFYCDNFRRITTVAECQSLPFFLVAHETSLFQPMGLSDFSSTAKNITKSVS